MTSVRGNLKDSCPISFFTGLLIIVQMTILSGCSTYIASKQDNVLAQINTWSAEDEFGKAFETLAYVKKTHPQYTNLQIRKKLLQTEAKKYEENVHKNILNLVQKKKWADALDLMEQAKIKYPQGEGIKKTEQFLIDKQTIALKKIDQTILLERSQWIINARPLYQGKLTIDPRNEDLIIYLDSLDIEAEELAQKLTHQSGIAIEQKHYVTAQARINLAIALAPTKERKKILAHLNNREKISQTKKKQAQKQTHEKKQNSILQDIEKSFKSGDLIKTKQLIASLDEKERNTPELLQLEQELERSIGYTIQNLFSDANKLYADGKFHQAITLWEKVLQYEPDNADAKENIIRAEKVIDKLSTLREKQQN